MKKIIMTVLVVLISFASFAGDILTLNNEMTFEGKVKKIKDCTVIFKANGEKYSVPANDIYSIQFADPEDKVYTEYMELAAQDPGSCLKGKEDAGAFHGKKVGHYFMGMLFGPFAMIGTLIANPTPEKGKQTYVKSTNKDEFSNPEYLKCYKSKAKGQLIGMEALGWGTWIAIVLLSGL